MKLYIQPECKIPYVTKTKQEKRIKCNLHYFVLIFFISFVILESDTINGSNLPGETQKNIEVLEPEPLEPEVGMVLIELNTEPKGANVLIDNNDYGLTPLTDILLTEGYHNIKISLNGIIIINERIEIKEDGRNYYFNLFEHLIASGKWNELVKFGNSAVDILINLLNDKDQHKRLKAIEMLGKVQNARAVIPLCSILEDEFAEVRKKAIIALGEIKDTRTIEPLRKVTKTDSDKEVRSVAKDVISELYRKKIEENKKLLEAVEKAIKKIEERSKKKQ